MEKQKFRIKPYIIAAIVSLIIGAGIFCLYFFVKAQTSGYGLIVGCDASFIAGAVVASIAFVMFASSEGFFDFVSYGFKQMGAMLFSKEPSHYNDFPGYKEHKAEQRKSRSHYYVIVIIVSALLLIAYFILRLVFKDLY